jgi:HSP20 family protein
MNEPGLLERNVFHSGVISDIPDCTTGGTPIANRRTMMTEIQNHTTRKAKDMLVRFQYPRVPNHVLESLFTTDSIKGTTRFLAMDIAELENELIVTAELPGVKKDQVKVTFESGILTVDAQRKPNELAEGAQLLLNEIRIRDFSRSIRINVEIDADKIVAALEDGILSVTLPKMEQAKPKQIEVKVK